MATTIKTEGQLAVYLFCDQTDDGWGFTKVKYFKNGLEAGRFVSSANIVATDRAKQEFEAYLKDPEAAAEGQTYLDLLQGVMAEFEMKISEAK